MGKGAVVTGGAATGGGFLYMLGQWGIAILITTASILLAVYILDRILGRPGKPGVLAKGRVIARAAKNKASQTFSRKSEGDVIEEPAA